MISILPIVAVIIKILHRKKILVRLKHANICPPRIDIYYIFVPEVANAGLLCASSCLLPPPADDASCAAWCGNLKFNGYFWIVRQHKHTHYDS